MIFQILIVFFLAGLFFFFCSLYFKLPILLLFAGVVIMGCGSSLMLEGQSMMSLNWEEETISRAGVEVKTYTFVSAEEYAVKNEYSNLAGLVLILIGLSFTLESVSLVWKGKSLIK